MTIPKKIMMVRKKLIKAGRIASEALAFTCGLVKTNASLLDIVEAGEAKIKELGGQPAFPINISLNHHAAHYTPSLEDDTTIPEHALVKVDLGAHIDGYIADNAHTVLIGDDEKLHTLIQSAEAGLQAAIHTIRAGLRVWNVSKAIAAAMRQLKTRPIENLTGHSIEMFNLHAGISVPAVARSSERFASPRFKEHMVVAIEPFATFSQNPRVENLEPGHIFGFTRARNPSNAKLRSLFSQMKAKFAQLPFASRWMAELIPTDQISLTLDSLQKERCIHNYPLLGLRDRSFIAQAEHTVIVKRNGCIVTTKRDKK